MSRKPWQRYKGVTLLQKKIYSFLESIIGYGPAENAYVFLKYGEMILPPFIFMIDHIINLMNKFHHKYISRVPKNYSQPKYEI